MVSIEEAHLRGDDLFGGSLMADCDRFLDPWAGGCIILIIKIRLIF
jgi:hypothetical protein